MTNIIQSAAEIFDRVAFQHAWKCAFFNLEPEHTEEKAVTNFVPENHYFRLVINEMFLEHSTQFWATYEPMVFAAVEFIYGNNMREEPKVVGVNLLSADRQKLAPRGMRFIDTPISGLHPYIGGDFTFTVILYQNQITDYLRNLVSIVEKVVGAFNPSIALPNYLGVSNVILDGMDMILGTKKVVPVIAVRQGMNVALKGEFKPGYFVLINKPEQEIDQNKFWVKGNRLCFGESLLKAEPYADTDYVLLSIAQLTERTDVALLPFSLLWEETRRLVSKSNSWEDAKLSFGTLCTEVELSPDLTAPQKEKLSEEYRSKFVEIRKKVNSREQMGTFREVEPEQTSGIHQVAVDLNTLFQSLE
jgi:hypothetical protein